jgi:hypothetical protein
MKIMATKVSSTQENVSVAGIKDGVVILKNGQYRIILSASAINFDLKSEQEQNSIIFNYQSFLNSLHFPIEILISSKKLDLTPYLNRIKKLSEKQTNELLKIQTEDYIDFVSQLINLANIMKKSFYVVVGYQPLTVSGGGLLDKLFKKSESDSQIKVSEEDFNRYAGELRQRATTVAQGLGSIGLHCKQLTTEEIIELLYGTYNPEVAGKERLSGEATNFSSQFISQKAGEQDSGASNGTLAGGEITIDNTDIVNAQQKKFQEERKQETEKAAEKDIKAPLAIPHSAPKSTPQKVDDKAEGSSIKVDTPQPIPAEVNQGAPLSPQGLSGTVVEDVKEPGSIKQQPVPTQGAKSATDFDKSIKDPNSNKNFGW